MKIFVITDTDGNGEDRSLIVAARDTEGARQEWQAYFEIEDDDEDGTMPDRIFKTELMLPPGYNQPFPLGWHNDHMHQVAGLL